MSRTHGLIPRYIVSEEIPLRERLVNVLCVAGLVMLLIAFASRLAMGASLAVLTLLAAIALAAVAFFLVCNVFRLHRYATLPFIIVFCDVIMPTFLFLQGGADSGMPAYFVLSITVIMLLSEGSNRYILLSTHILLVIGCYVVIYQDPTLVTPMDPSLPWAQTLDHIQSFIVSGLFVAMVFGFHEQVYEKEKEKVTWANNSLMAEQQIISALFASNPHINILFDDGFRVLDCNPAAVEFAGFSTKEEMVEGFVDLLEQSAMPKSLPNGKPTASIHDRLRKAAQDGYMEFVTSVVIHENTHRMSVVMKRIPFRDSYAIVVYMVDITELITVRNRLINVTKLLNAAHVSARLLFMKPMEEVASAISSAMGEIAKSVGADHVRIFQNRMIGGAPHCVLAGQWSDTLPAEGDAGDGTREGVQRGAAVSEMPCPMPQTGWQERFSRSSLSVVNGPVGALPSSERVILADGDARSVLAVPMYLQDEYWGFIVFGDADEDRDFTDTEVEILRASGLMIAATITRHEMFHNLQEAREQALASARAKTAFLASMSHEIRTPLNAVIGMAAIGAGAVNLDRKDYAFGKIRDASMHLLGVINNILDMSKIDAGKLALSAVPFDFERMLQGVVDILNFTIEAKGLRFTVFLDRNIPRWLLGDSQRLAQVVMNLLGNAAKFTPEGGSVTLAARLADKEDGVCSIEVSVTDTGIGVTLEQQARLFRSFEQAESGTSRKYGGSGLGLAISKRIVEMMDGRIWITSVPGEGSTFAFSVRLPQTGADVQPWRQALAGHRAVVVDADAAAAASCRDILEGFGAACEVAADGDAGLAQAGGAIHDVCIMDWDAPGGMVGDALVREFRRRMPEGIIIVAAHPSSREGIERSALGAGADAVLVRPIFPTPLAECLGLGGKEGGEEDGQTPRQVAEAHDFVRCHLLLVEDVEINREIVQAILEPTNIRITCAESGAAAIELFGRYHESLDVIFMDVQMPEMDGYETTRAIRAMDLPKAKTVPIVAMTANVFKEDVERCLAAGMNDHIGKPLDCDVLLAKLRAHLPRS